MALVDTIKLMALGLFKVPMIFYTAPTVVEIDLKRCVIKIPLNRRTRNHWGTMYFGTLAVGADCAGGSLAWRIAEEKFGGKISIISKEFHAEFLRRPEGHTFFSCEDGDSITAAMDRATQSGERQNLPIMITATVPSKGSDPVAKFKLTLSLKHEKNQQLKSSLI
jgi:hypothetical protein